jgi:hypothetical protein
MGGGLIFPTAVVDCPAVRFSPLLGVLGLLGCLSQPAPVLSRVNPPELSGELGGVVTLEGEGFLPAGTYDFDRPDASTLATTVAASLEREGASAPLLDVRWRDARAVEARVPPGLPLGAWSVRLTTPRGATLTLADGLRLSPFVTDAGLLLDGGQPDGGFDAGALPCDRLTYFDEDLDGFGAPDSGGFFCGPGRAADAGDCNDLDSLTSPSGLERCNGLDDDCDGVVDDGLACTDAGLRAFPDLAAPNHDLLAASAWTGDRLWIAGGAKLFVRRANGTFADESQNCPAGLNAAWSAPGGRRAFVAGGNNGVGRLTTADQGDGCADSVLLQEPVAGLVGFPAADGGVRVEVILRDGHHVAWDGVAPVVAEGTKLPAGTSLVDAHAVVPGAFFAVGGTLGPPLRPAVFRMDFGGAFVAEELPAGLPDGWLRGVWAVSPFEAVAVGDEGMVVRRRFGRWEAVRAPEPTGYSAVRAFSVGRFYAVSDGGLVQQWSGRWQGRATQPRAVRDIDGVDEEHLWLVGDDGLVVGGAPLP